MKKLFTFLLSLTIGFLSFAQTPLVKNDYTLLSGKSFVQSKNYYFLTLLQSNPSVKQIISNDSTLRKILQKKLQNITTTPNQCQNVVSCFTEQMKFNETEIQTIGERLKFFYDNNAPFKTLIANHLITSGTYILSNTLSPKDLLVKAWEQDARGINFTISVYIEGKKPNYPAIDSTSFKVNHKSYPQVVADLSRVIVEETKNAQLFFEPSLSAALIALEINEREQAGDYEPMTKTVNKLAYDRIKTIQWDKYRYAVILVPGSGNEELDRALSAEGMLRCRVAALRYFEGLAPFVMVSGGKVHPYKTIYNEAIEMKKYMVEKLHVPENAVIVEPHARHTTTNMRNAARIIFRYGIPFEKPCITSTSKSQSMYIQELNLDKRCEQELKHIPYRKGKRLSETEAEFYPLIEALQINPFEPLDP